MFTPSNRFTAAGLLRSDRRVRARARVQGAARTQNGMLQAFHSGSIVLADQDPSGFAICDVQNDRLSAPRLDWLHSDDEEFHRLIGILKPQLQADLRRSSSSRAGGPG
ncbi:MAG TPA: hypothetical protein VKY22_24155 [Bradyrhizobium sp.]|nr:hypothetical protein [Bradyrhizobium sp.]